jgi:hypothetical protein
VADTRIWIATPQKNFGWILLEDETAPQSVKSFASREEPDPSLRPVLEVTYSLPGNVRAHGSDAATLDASASAGPLDATATPAGNRLFDGTRRASTRAKRIR